LNGEITGQCNTLWQSTLTVNVPKNRLYFIPTTAQLSVLIIGSLLLVIVIIYLLHFGWIVQQSDTNELPFLSPTGASQLLFDTGNTEVELLCLALERRVQRTNVGPDDLTVAFSEFDLKPIDSVSHLNFTPRQSYSGNDLNEILRQDDVSKEAERKLREKGYISGYCDAHHWWLAFPIASFLPQTEYACAYQTVCPPVSLLVLIVWPSFAFRRFASPWRDSVHLDKLRFPAFVFSTT
jgi:hypothetical protein